MNVVIYPLIRDLHTNIGTIQSIIAIYSLLMACLIIFVSKLQNVLGRRRTFISGAAIVIIILIIGLICSLLIPVQKKHPEHVKGQVNCEV